MANKKVVLAYSGGLDTSVAIPWLTEQGWDVIAVCLDVGEGKDLEFIKNKALQVGAVESYMIDAKDEFAEDFALVSLQAHTWYEQKYPLVSALSRPLISKKLVEIANETNADAVAHGCTGKGNDQVRFEISIKALNPDLEVLAPVREWKFGAVTKKSNMQRSIMCRFLRHLIHHSQSTKTCGAVQTKRVLWKIHGLHHQKKLTV